ncbi:MAG: DUF6095 family protein [Polaribacter sp.]|nr:DUF6095 family protein [Polaribacter sp.]
MSIDTNLLGKGFKRLSFLVVLLIVSPLTLNIGFKALNAYSEESLWIAYGIIGIAMLLIISTIIVGFKTFKTLLDALFNSTN